MMTYNDGFGGCRVKILRGEHAGKEAFLYEHSQEVPEAFALFLVEDDRPGQASPVYHVRFEDLECLEMRQFEKSRLDDPDHLATEAEWAADRAAGRLDEL
jgi:hypothetical protein